MPKIKIPKKSTNIDMTAMCDVAFLLLTFFMLATKFKPTEAVEIKTPNSVSSKMIPEKDVCIVSLDKDGKVYLQLDNPNAKADVLEGINTEKSLGLTKTDIKAFVNFPSVGVPFSQLASLLKVDMADLGTVKQNGIPVDSTNNELKTWIRYILTAYAGRKLNILVKGDAATKYPSFKNVIDAFKANDQLKFQLITTPEDAPTGTALYESRKKQS